MIIRRIFSSVFTLMVFAPVQLGADPVKPELPKIAEVEAEEATSGKYVFRVSLFFANGRSAEGTIRLMTDKLDLSGAASGMIGRRTVQLAQVGSIEFVKWKGSRRIKDSYGFYPSRIRVFFADGSVYEGESSTAQFNSVSLEEQPGKKITVYTCFFDYRKKDRWVNSGEKDMRYPESNPHPDTVIKILFKK